MEEVNQNDNLVFSYLNIIKENNDGVVLATVCYANRENDVCYGVTVLSESELDYDFDFGLEKSYSRCLEAVDGKSSDWKPYKKNEESFNNRVSVFKSLGFKKLGTMDKEDFKEKLSTLI